MLLDQVQQPARAAQGGRDRRRERHLHRLRPDQHGRLTADGSDGVNDVTYLLLDVIEEMRLLQPSSSIQVSKKNPDRFIKRAGKIIRTGFGQPSIFNADLIVQELVRHGQDRGRCALRRLERLRGGGRVRQGDYILTGYFNLPKVLELTLHNGVDPRTGRQLGPQTGDPASFATFDELFAAFETQLRHFIDIKVRGNNVIERLYADLHARAVPLAADRRLHRQGQGLSRRRRALQHHLHPGRGLGTITDCLSAIKYHVFDQRTLTHGRAAGRAGRRFRRARARAPAAAQPHPALRQRRRLRRRADGRVFEAYFDAVDGRKNTRGGDVPHQPAADHLPRLLRLGDRRDAGRPPGAARRSPRASRPCRAPTATARPR